LLSAGEYFLKAAQDRPLAASVEEPNAIPDAEDLRQALAGEETAFRMLYERLKHGVFRYAFYMTNSRCAAEEVTQEVFMTLLEKGKSFNPAQGDLGAFTFGFARNIVRRVERRERSWRVRFHESELDETVAAPEELTGNLLRRERVARVRAAIQALPDHYRQPVVLCDLCELSYAEAAARLDCAVGTIRSRLNRAHALLAQKLKLSGAVATEMRDAGAEGCLT
jgi:RNA polymerase sigma-70 factor (ECF subfamily)